jgi:hypothetical protein
MPCCRALERDPCVFRDNPATDSTASRPPIPGQSGHGFHVKPATFSKDSWPPIPRQAGHLSDVNYSGRSASITLAGR